MIVFAEDFYFCVPTLLHEMAVAFYNPVLLNKAESYDRINSGSKEKRLHSEILVWTKLHYKATWHPHLCLTDVHNYDTARRRSQRGRKQWVWRDSKTRCKGVMILLLSPWELEQMRVKASVK